MELGPQCHAVRLWAGRVLTRTAKPLGGIWVWRTPELLQPTVVASHTSSDFFSFGRLLFKIVTRTRTMQGRSLGRSSLPPDGKPHS
jgi:hypothetical protein